MLLLPARLAPPVSTAAATAAKPAAVTAPASTAATAEGALFARPRFVYVQLAGPKISTIQRIDRALGFLIVAHLDESKAARAAGFTVRNDADAIHGPIRLKQATHGVFARAEAQIANEYILQADTPSYSNGGRRQGSWDGWDRT
jgi:hypothetical protein